MTEMQKIVVVLGMHRSGTSVAARLLQSIGVHLGDDLIEGATDNPDGYFENRRLVRIAAEILSKLRRSLPLRTGVLPMPDSWWLSDDFKGYKNELVEIVSSEIERASGGIWGFKDPRTLILLPLWQEVFSALKLEPRTLLCLRHPMAVAQSLKRRDKIPLRRGETIWANYLGSGVLHFQAQFDCVIEYERWFTEPIKQVNQMAQQLGLDVSKSGSNLAHEINKIIKPTYCHTSPDETAKFYLPKTEEFYHSLQRLVSGDDAQLRALEIAKEYRQGQLNLQEWSESIDALVSNSQRLYEVIRDRDEQISALSSKERVIMDMQNALSSYEHACNRLKHEVDSLQEQVRQGDEKWVLAKSEATRLESEAAELKLEVTKLSEQLEEAQLELAAAETLKDRLFHLRTEFDARTMQNEQKIETMERKIRAARRSLTEIEKVFASVEALGTPASSRLRPFLQQCLFFLRKASGR